MTLDLPPAPNGPLSLRERAGVRGGVSPMHHFPQRRPSFTQTAASRTCVICRKRLRVRSKSRVVSPLAKRSSGTVA